MQRTKLKKIVSKTQALQAIPITTPESESKSRQIMEKVSILNIYQFNFQNVVHVIFKVKYNSLSKIVQRKL